MAEIIISVFAGIWIITALNYEIYFEKETNSTHVEANYERGVSTLNQSDINKVSQLDETPYRFNLLNETEVNKLNSPIIEYIGYVKKMGSYLDLRLRKYTKRFIQASLW